MSYSRRAFRQRRGNHDANHLAIRDGLRKLGHHVIDLAGVGDGCPDLCVYPRPPAALPWQYDGLSLVAPGFESLEPVWLELKVGKGKLRASQVAWRASAEARGVRVATVRTIEEAIEALK